MVRPNYKVVFNRTFEEKKPDIGSRDDIRIGDCITFIIEDTFMTRAVAAVHGQIISTKPFPNEKRLMFERKIITQILREEAGNVNEK